MDRLTTLVERFHLSVTGADMDHANLLALADDQGQPSRIRFFARGLCNARDDEVVLFAAHVDWSGPSNPLLAALPDVVTLDLQPHQDTKALVFLMHQEALAKRCGAQSVVNRLGEALIVRLLRDQIEKGTTEVGLLAGMADPRLSRAIVAMHDQPGHLWSNADLAQQAGLSLSRFCEVFTRTVGETPMGYLRRWRLILARQDVMRGDRIERVAHRYAYTSPESFTRAFRKAYGTAPRTLRT
ncbi:AraC family transcriptional regulator [Shimia thalassica]|uniref:AraC family transcriptional regulator n=1 Tax=Shimia thalassica TaxID=1715693 RepID=UPI0027338BBF|nr:AraC family transcriptional regulator [Shimia thalassica]MDP2579506.1 AraC family transcriptional regulator [Shimia thalassica]